MHNGSSSSNQSELEVKNHQSSPPFLDFCHNRMWNLPCLLLAAWNYWYCFHQFHQIACTSIKINNISSIITCLIIVHNSLNSASIYGPFFSFYSLLHFKYHEERTCLNSSEYFQSKQVFSQSFVDEHHLATTSQ